MICKAFCHSCGTIIGIKKLDYTCKELYYMVPCMLLLVPTVLIVIDTEPDAISSTIVTRSKSFNRC